VKELILPLTLINGTCPKCRKPVKLSAIEPHPTRPDLAIHNYHRIDCGSVKVGIISLKQPETTPASKSNGGVQLTDDDRERL
jgi:hypothetical protein